MGISCHFTHLSRTWAMFSQFFFHRMDGIKPQDLVVIIESEYIKKVSLFDWLI